MPSRVDSRRKLGREVRIRRVDLGSVVAVAFVHVLCILLDRTTQVDNRGTTDADTKAQRSNLRASV